MNSEAQEVINTQYNKRLTDLENDMKEVKATVTEIRIDQKDIKADQKYLIETLNKVNKRWEDFDQTQRKNRNDLIMKFLGCIVTGIVGYILAVLKFNK